MTNRRGVLAALGAGALSVSNSSFAQQTQKIARVGFLGLSTPEITATRLAGLRAGLSELGYFEGKNLVFEFRWAESKYDRLAGLAAELVNLNVDVIVAHGTPGARAAKQATNRIPIVMAAVSDPIATGLVASLANPGGNVTGPTYFGVELNAKRLELLRDTLPRAKQVAVLFNPENTFTPPVLEAMDATARAVKMELVKIAIKGPSSLDDAFAAMSTRRVEGVVVVDDGMLNANVAAIAARAGKSRTPSIGILEFAEAGGLMAYGADVPDQFRRAAAYVDKLLKGARPGNLPVERATRFNLVVNLKTAKMIGVAVPRLLLQRADQTIE